MTGGQNFTRWFNGRHGRYALSETSPGRAKLMLHTALQNCERNKRVAEFVAQELVRVRKRKGRLT